MSKHTKTVSPFNVIENGFGESQLSSWEMSSLTGGLSGETPFCIDIEICGIQAKGCISKEINV